MELWEWDGGVVGVEFGDFYEVEGVGWVGVEDGRVGGVVVVGEEGV